MKIKELRAKAGYSQIQLATLLNVSRSTVAMWETGASSPDSSMLDKIATLFGVSVDYLLGRNEKTTKKEAPSEMNTEEAIMLALSNMLGRKPTEEELKRFLVMTKAFFNVPDEQ